MFRARPPLSVCKVRASSEIPALGDLAIAGASTEDSDESTSATNPIPWEPLFDLRERDMLWTDELQVRPAFLFCLYAATPLSLA